MHGTPPRLRPRLHHDQQPHLQVDVLQRAGCYRVFSETASGARSDRPTLEQLLDQLRPGDTLVVWKLDRLGRSLRHLVDTVTGLADRGVGFRSLQEAIDTTTPGDKLVFHVFAALAEFERDPVHERTSAGLAAARARGRRGGRPSVMTGHKLWVAREMYASGQYTVAVIAKTLGVSRASVYRHLTRAAGDQAVRGKPLRLPDLLHAIEGPSGQAMLVTPFTLVMDQVGIDRCGPPVSVVDPSPILHPSSRFAHSQARRAAAFGHSVLCHLPACLLPPKGTV